MPVKDTKVSTNSARDIIPGAHLSSRIQNRILNGKFVDMVKPIPPDEDPQVKDKAGASLRKK